MYVCRYCDFHANTQDLLRRHTASYHITTVGGPLCPRCLRAFSRRDTLVRHLSSTPCGKVPRRHMRRPTPPPDTPPVSPPASPSLTSSPPHTTTESQSDGVEITEVTEEYEVLPHIWGYLPAPRGGLSESDARPSVAVQTNVQVIPLPPITRQVSVQTGLNRAAVAVQTGILLPGFMVPDRHGGPRPIARVKPLTPPLPEEPQPGPSGQQPQPQQQQHLDPSEDIVEIPDSDDDNYSEYTIHSSDESTMDTD